MANQCKPYFIHPNKNLFKENLLLLVSCWELLGRLCNPVIEHYSITQNHTGAAHVIWEDILSSGVFEVNLNSAAGSLKTHPNQPTLSQNNKTQTNNRGSEAIPTAEDQHVNCRLH